MAENLLARLAVAGVIERTRGRTILRVTPRFLAHAEAAAGRLRAAIHVTPQGALEAALATWDGYTGDTRSAALFLESLLAEREQLGSLRPVFPSLESFAAA